MNHNKVFFTNNFEEDLQKIRKRNVIVYNYLFEQIILYFYFNSIQELMESSKKLSTNDANGRRKRIGKYNILFQIKRDEDKVLILKIEEHRNLKKLNIEGEKMEVVERSTSESRKVINLDGRMNATSIVLTDEDIKTVNIVQKMSKVKIDLSNFDYPYENLIINLDIKFSGVELIVREGTKLINEAKNIASSIGDTNAGEYNNQKIILQGRILMSSVEVKTV